MLAAMLVLGRRDVEALLDIEELIDALSTTMVDVSAGRASTPQRIAALVPEREAMLAAMPGYVPSAQALMSKLVSLFPHNAGTVVPTHQAVVIVFDPVSGTPVALLDGTSITATRTAACSALSVRLLARPNAATLAILGTGVQARSHALAVTKVRPIREVRIAGRNLARARALADELSHILDVELRVVGSFAEALAGADVACATTHALAPVVRRQWVCPGMHITSVGYNVKGREVDDETVGDSLMYVESRRAVLAPVPTGSRDVIEPVERGVITEARIHELGELIAGTRPGRTSNEQITLYKSVGVAAQDAAAAALVLAAARKVGAGRELALS
jgi:ornithine cyclodeaminase